jgi:glycosyltransferase involved in cell wall biosynthesis
MSQLLTTLAVPDGTGAMAMMSAYTSALVSAGHSVTLVHGPVPADHQRPGTRVQQIFEGLDAIGVDRVVLDGLQSTYGVKTVRNLARLVSERNAEAIIAYQQVERKYALVAASRCGIPCVISGGNQHHFFGPKPVRWLKRRSYGHVLRRVSMFVATSEMVQHEAIGEFGVQPDHTAVVPNGISTPASSAASRTATRAELGVGVDDVVAMCVGRLDVQKGQDRLIEALGHVDGDALKRLRIVFVGDVPASRNGKRMTDYRDRLHDAAKRSVVVGTVTFAGWSDDVSRLLAAADFYVQPSRWEGPPLPVAALEAMAAGNAIVLTDCSGHPEGFVDGTHGYVVPNGSSEELGRAVQLMATISSGERARMGIAAQQLRASQYDLDATAPQFVRVVEGAIHQDTEGVKT